MFDITNNMDYPTLNDIVWVSAGGIAAVVVFHAENLIRSYYREKHPKKSKPKAVFIDPRSDFEKIMNDFDYHRRLEIYNNDANDWVKYCPWPNLNLDTVFGRFATREGFYKSKQSKKIKNPISPIPSSCIK